MSLVLEYLRLYGVKQIEIQISGRKGGGGAKSVVFAANEPRGLTLEANLARSHLAKWTNAYLHERYGNWYNGPGGDGVLMLSWTGRGWTGRLDFREYYDDDEEVIIEIETEVSIDEKTLLKIDNTLPPDLRSRMEREVLSRKMPAEPLQKKAKSLGL